MGDATVGKTHLLSRYVKGEINGNCEGKSLVKICQNCEEIGRFTSEIFVDWLSAIGTLPKAPTATIGVEFATRQGLKIERSNVARYWNYEVRH